MDFTDSESDLVSAACAEKEVKLLIRKNDTVAVQIGNC